ncbi:MAG: MmgE/PrpD family protein, partial [Microbacterium sp.]
VARHALGVVASLAAGSRANFGSMTKPLHAGAAARDAIMAVELAEAGFTANAAELDATAGFLERYGDLDAGPVGTAAETLEERLEYWAQAWPQNWGLKRYPSCYGTHRGIDAMLALRDEIGDAEPTAIRATLHPRGTRPLRTALPTDGTEAKFSLEYTLAVALRRGEVLLDDFSDETFADPAVHALVPRVAVGESEVPPRGPAAFAPGYTVVEVEFADRPPLWARVEVTHGVSSDPLTDDELRAKVVDCAVAGGLGGEAAALADALIAAVKAAPGPAFTSVIPNRSHA